MPDKGICQPLTNSPNLFCLAGIADVRHEFVIASVRIIYGFLVEPKINREAQLSRVHFVVDNIQAFVPLFHAERIWEMTVKSQSALVGFPINCLKKGSVAIKSQSHLLYVMSANMVQRQRAEI
jgi:hypothetical protein